MKQIDYKLIEESFFNTYHAFISFLRLIRTENSTYSIYVSRIDLQNNLTKVSIEIKNNNLSDFNQNLTNSIILTNEESINLINNIRTDFRENHYISFSTVNQKEHIQTLQNTNFTLKIELKNDNEIEEAINFNEQINTNGERHKVLSRS